MAHKLHPGQNVSYIIIGAVWHCAYKNRLSAVRALTYNAQTGTVH